jgi:hypothetical protein
MRTWAATVLLGSLALVSCSSGSKSPPDTSTLIADGAAVPDFGAPDLAGPDVALPDLRSARPSRSHAARRADPILGTTRPETP